MSLQMNRPNPAKPSIVKRHGVWLARVQHPVDGFIVDGALTLPEAYAKAINYAHNIARDTAA